MLTKKILRALEVVGIYQSDLIPNKEKQAHCSSIIELPNGIFLTSFYAGTREVSPDSKLYTSIYNLKEKKWETPQVRLNTPNESDGNAILFLDKSGKIWLFNNTIRKSFKKYPRVRNWEATDNKLIFSDDFGKSWSDLQAFFPEKIGANFKNKAIYTNAGTILVPMYDDLYKKSFIVLSKDDGKTWEMSKPIETPSVKDANDIPKIGNIQPTLIQKENGAILAYLRPAGFSLNQSRILQSESKDNGLTWSRTRETGFKNPGSGIDMVKLSNGKVVLVYNDNRLLRNKLCVAITEDDCETWSKGKVLEFGLPWHEFSYPAVIQDTKWLIHITYTYRRKYIKHVVINEEWILK